MWAKNLCLQREKKSSTKGRYSEDLEYIPEPGEVVEGFDVTDEKDTDLEDESVPQAIEVLVLSCIKFRGGVGSNAMLYSLDSNEICTCLLLKFISPILVSGLKEP